MGKAEDLSGKYFNQLYVLSLKEEYCKNKKIPLIILKYSDFINKEDVIKEEFL